MRPVSDERALVEKLRERFRADAPTVRVGIGDDAAVVSLPGESVLTVDVSVEDVHFRRDFGPLDVLAERAFHAAASDLAAMGAAPACALVSLVLPSSLDEAGLDAILVGLARAARELALPIVGGNTSRGPSIAINTTAIGRADRPILRSGARPGDGLFVTGSTGDRALGLELLLRGGAACVPSSLRGHAARFVDAWLRPRARLEAGLALAGVASSAIDVSDGLALDLHRILDASGPGLGARVDADAIPVSEGFADVARALGVAPDAILLGGGEAYELLFTAAPDVVLPFSATALGRITDDGAVHVRTGDVTRPLSPVGFDHLRERQS